MAAAEPYHQLCQGSNLNLRWFSRFSIFLGTPGCTRTARQQVIRFALLVYKVRPETFEVSLAAMDIPLRANDPEKNRLPRQNLANLSLRGIFRCTWSIEIERGSPTEKRAIDLLTRGEDIDLVLVSMELDVSEVNFSGHCIPLGKRTSFIRQNHQKYILEHNIYKYY